MAPKRITEGQIQNVFQAGVARPAAVLTPLSPEAWRRSGTIKGRTHTVFSQTRRMALHEEGHRHQLATLLTRPV